MDRSNIIRRIIIALIIAAIGFGIYMCQVEKNPVTGEKQHVSLSPEQEIRLGIESAGRMSYEMGGDIPESDPRTRIVKNLGARLVNTKIAQNSPWGFNFHLLADPQTVNAFALPGGQIFITLGLFDKLNNEAELAGVLGHEMGHVIERHAAQQMAKNQLGQTMVVAVGTAASDRRNSAAVIAAFVNQIIQLRYGRQDESESDEWGLRLTEEAGFDPRAMVHVMQILKAQSRGGYTPQIFQSHPNPDLRIKQIQNYLAKHVPASNLSNGRNLRDLIRENY